MVGTSSITKSSKNLLLSRDVAEVDEVGLDSGGDCKDETVGKSQSKNSNGATDYLIPNARQTLTQLKQAFTKAPILWHFDLKCHIWIETDASGYAIDEGLN